MTYLNSSPENTEGIECLSTWLEQVAQKHQLDYLLAHADDGVTWGHFQQGSLITSACIQSDLCQYPRLQLETLQQCRIFGSKGEVLLWRVGNSWQARFVSDQDEKIVEKQILLGSHGRKHPDLGFTELWDGKQGLNHAVPCIGLGIDDSGQLIDRIHLVVHHYFGYDNENGVARIVCSRLVGFELHPLSKMTKTGGGAA